MTQDNKGVSAMKLHRHLEIAYNAAWRIGHKLMQVMMERDRSRPLSGWISARRRRISPGLLQVVKQARSWLARLHALCRRRVQIPTSSVESRCA